MTQLLIISLLTLCGYGLYFAIMRGQTIDKRLLFWTITLICRVFCAVIFVCFNSGELSFSLSGIRNGAIMLGFMLVLVCIFELCAPANRFSRLFGKKESAQNIDRAEKEDSLDSFYRLVCNILSGFLAVLPLLRLFGASMDGHDAQMLFDGIYAIGGVCLVITCSVSVRQLLYRLSCDKSNEAESGVLSVRAKRCLKARNRHL